MNADKWDQIKTIILDKYPDAEKYSEDLYMETGDGRKKVGKSDVVEFETPQWRFKLVCEQKPVVLDKQMHYSHRPGDTARTEYKFSETETTSRLKLFKLMEDDSWNEVSLETLAM